jgi:hypothetical protein
MTADAAPVANLNVVHSAKGRLRLRLAGPVPGDAALQTLADRLASVEGVRRARIRPNTGSVILDLTQPGADVLDAIALSGAARLTAPAEPPPVARVLELGLAGADRRVAQETGGALDLRTAIGLALLGGAILQAVRGQVAGPATTLAIAAYSLLARSET